jgi:hypothetical protein
MKGDTCRLNSRTFLDNFLPDSLLDVYRLLLEISGE